jgi:hypothetical protein
MAFVGCRIVLTFACDWFSRIDEQADDIWFLRTVFSRLVHLSRHKLGNRVEVDIGSASHSLGTLEHRNATETIRIEEAYTMSNPNQLFLLADHIKLSLLERQRAISLNLEPNSQDGHISRSLESMREGLEGVTTERERLEQAGDSMYEIQASQTVSSH